MDPEITDTLEPKTKWAICMGPTENLQGSYKFLSLATGKKVMQRKFTKMPVTEAVIKQVEEMAVKDGAVKGVILKIEKEWSTNLTMMRNTRCWWNLTSQNLSQIFQ